MLPSKFTLVSYLWKTICTVLHLGPVIAYILLSFTVKESVKCIDSLNKFCNVHCKSGYTIFYQPSLQPPVYTNLT